MDCMHETLEGDEAVTRRECYLYRSAMENRIGGFESQMIELRTELRNVKDTLNGFRADMSREREERIKFEAVIGGEFANLGMRIGAFEAILYKKTTWILILLLIAAGGVILGRFLDFEAIMNVVP